jgi:L-rhamnose isomerase
MSIIQKLNKIMADVVSTNMEWCGDHLLIIINEILHLAAELKKRDATTKVAQEVFDALMINFSLFSNLLTASDIVS